MADTLDVEDTLVASLAGLGLWQVPGLKGDRLHLPRRDEDLLRAHQLGAVLEEAGTGQRWHVSGKVFNLQDERNCSFTQMEKITAEVQPQQYPSVAEFITKTILKLLS